MWRSPINSPAYLSGWNYLQAKRNELLQYTQQYLNSAEYNARQAELYRWSVKSAQAHGNPPPVIPNPQERLQIEYNLVTEQGNKFVNFLGELKQVVQALATPQGIIKEPKYKHTKIAG
jgi:hypothetical protein